MSITTTKYIGPQLPLVKNKQFGDYVLTSDYAVQVKQNLKNIVMTNKGERMMDKDFGLGIRAYLFESNTVGAFDGIKSDLIKQVSTYLGDVVEIKDVVVDQNTQNPNVISVQIYYNIPDLEVEDVLELYFQ